MTDNAEMPSAPPPISRADLPGRLADGMTVLVAGPNDPSFDAVGLQILSELGRPADSALVVSTTESVTRTTETYDLVSSGTDRPSLGVVDTTSKRQSISVLSDDTPVVYTPAPGDIERLIVALSELTGDDAPGKGDRHLLVRSLTPILESTSLSLVCTALERITGLRTERGLCLLGVDQTAHDGETRRAITDVVDGVLRVTRTDHGQISFEFELTSGRYSRS